MPGQVPGIATTFKKDLLFTSKLRSHLILVRVCLFEGLDQHTGCTAARLWILTRNQVTISLDMIGPIGPINKICSQFSQARF